MKINISWAISSTFSSLTPLGRYRLITGYVGFAPVCAAFCQTSDRAIRSQRYLIPRIVDGKICPVDSEVLKIDTRVEAYLQFGGHKKTKFVCGSAMCEFYIHIIVYLGTIRGIRYSDLPIPRIEAACRSSSEVSSFDYDKSHSHRFISVYHENRFVEIHSPHEPLVDL